MLEDESGVAVTNLDRDLVTVIASVTASVTASVIPPSWRTKGAYIGTCVTKPFVGVETGGVAVTVTLTVGVEGVDPLINTTKRDYYSWSRNQPLKY